MATSHPDGGPSHDRDGGQTNGATSTQQDRSEEIESPGDANQKQVASDAAPQIWDNAYFRPLSEDKGSLPAWLDHFNLRDFKIVFKCSLAVWAYALLMLINPTLQTIGQATFFGAILLFMVPPSGSVFFVLLAGGTIIVGVCLAWAWGVIVMKAALAARPAADLAQRYAELQAMAPANTTNVSQASGQAAFQQIAIFNGFMLDTRVTLTYYCLLCLFIYLLARLRIRAPKLTLMSIFAIIITDIFLTIAPLIPTFQGTLPKTLIVPASIGTGFGVFFNLLVFPTSSINLVLDGMSGLLKPMGELLDASAMKTSRPFERMQLARLAATRAKLIAGYTAVQAPVGFLPIDAYYGKLGALEVQSLQQPFRQVLVAFLRLLQMQADREEQATRHDKLKEMVDSFATDEREAQTAGRRHIAAIYDIRQRFGHDPNQFPSEETAPELVQTYKNALDTCRRAVDVSHRILDQCNTNTWPGQRAKQSSDGEQAANLEALEQLRQQNKEFAEQAAEYLQAHYAEMLMQMSKQAVEDDETPLPPAHGLVVSLILEENLLNLSSALETFLSRLIKLQQNRPTSRVWLPAKIQKIFGWAVDMDDTESVASENTLAGSEASDAATSSKQVTEKEPEPEADRPSAAKQLAQMKRNGGRRRSRGGKVAMGIIHWFTNEEGIFAFRMLVATFAVGLIAVNRNTAGFFYREKGLWALIMAQTGLSLYLGDFVFGTAVRVLGTVCGAVMGLVAWYIGAGRGPGNPYGMAAILAPAIIILMWLRLHLPPSLLAGAIIGAATFFLVIGYSWDDTHIPSYGNPGVGYEVFYRRLLLVMIGLGVGAVVTLLPYPPSAAKHQRKVLADNIAALKNHYALFVNNCRNPSEDLERVAEQKVIEMGSVLDMLYPQIQLAKLEFSTSSLDVTALQILCRQCKTLNRAIAQLLLTVPRLPEAMKTRFIRTSGCLDEQIVSEIMSLLTLLEQTLRLDRPLPVILPILQNTSSRIWIARRHERLGQELSKAVLAEPGVRKYCEGMAGLVQVLSSIDEMVIVVKRAVGETSNIDAELL